jgi:hypothetical protein
VYDQYKGGYKPIIDSAKKEQSAKGQCKWIMTMLEILALNHLPHIEQGQNKMVEEQKKSTKKIMVFLFIVLLVVLTTNPQVLSIIGKLFAFVF